MKIYPLCRSVLSVSNNAEQFLNGLTSNSLDKNKNAFLDIHGKIIATFDQIKAGADTFWLILENDFVDGVLKHVDRFAKLSKAVIQKEDLQVYFDLEGSYSPSSEERSIPQKSGQIILTNKKLPANVSDEEFALFRLRHDIPLQGKDYTHEMLLNVDDHDYISFTKGCFLGQEPVAKVHNRSKPTWKLVVQAEGEAMTAERQPMTSKTFDPQTGKTLGFVFVKND